MTAITRVGENYATNDGRFQVERSAGRLYTRGPFKTFWNVRDTRTGRSHQGLPSLDRVREFIERNLEVGQ